MTGFITMTWSYALTAPTHLDTAHCQQNYRTLERRRHSIQYDLTTGKSQKRSLASTRLQKFTDYSTVYTLYEEMQE